jgi:hypothetical protein
VLRLTRRLEACSLSEAQRPAVADLGDVEAASVFDLHPLPGTYRAGPFELKIAIAAA